MRRDLRGSTITARQIGNGGGNGLVPAQSAGEIVTSPNGHSSLPGSLYTIKRRSKLLPMSKVDSQSKLQLPRRIAGDQRRDRAEACRILRVVWGGVVDDIENVEGLGAKLEIGVFFPNWKSLEHRKIELRDVIAGEVIPRRVAVAVTRDGKGRGVEPLLNRRVGKVGTARLVGAGITDAIHGAAYVGYIAVDQHAERLAGANAEDRVALPAAQDPRARPGSQVLTSSPKWKLVDDGRGKELRDIKRGRTVIGGRMVVVLNTCASSSRSIFGCEETAGSVVGGF